MISGGQLASSEKDKPKGKGKSEATKQILLSSGLEAIGGASGGILSALLEKDERPIPSKAGIPTASVGSVGSGAGQYPLYAGGPPRLGTERASLALEMLKRGGYS